MTDVVRHTPGPWDVGQNGDSCAREHAIVSGPKVIAKVYGRGYPSGFGWSPGSAADARLIAAAPELLAALKACEDRLALVLECDCDDDKPEDTETIAAFAAARAAIAKAEGFVP